MEPRLSPIFASLAAVAILLGGCGGKKKEEPVGVAPPPGAASSDELSTGIGQARGLDDRLAPTSTKWRRVIVISETRAIITGDIAAETMALATSDAGKTWRALRTGKDTWANWSAAADGSVVLAEGARDGAPSPTAGTVQATRVLFGSLDDSTLTAPTPLFPDLKGSPAKGLVQNDSAVPALLSPDAVALIGEESPRKLAVFYGGKPGAEAVARVSLPGAEKIIPVPFGRPPVMLSIRGRDLLARPFPVPGKPLEKPQKVAGVAVTRTLGAELGVPPACETGEWSYQLVKQPPARLQVVGISAAKTITFPLPDPVLPTTRLGCGGGRFVAEGADPKTREPLFYTCDAAGKCVVPQQRAFRLWPDKHEREVVATPVEQGVVGVMAARAGDRWGLYLAQSPDGGVWERPRVLGEGAGDRGRVELGALVSFGKRVLILLSAEVTGTSRRGWFVIASDDGGVNWGPP